MFLHLGPNMGPQLNKFTNRLHLTTVFTASYNFIVSISHLPIRTYRFLRSNWVTWHAIPRRSILIMGSNLYSRAVCGDTCGPGYKRTEGVRKGAWR